MHRIPYFIVLGATICLINGAYGEYDTSEQRAIAERITTEQLQMPDVQTVREFIKKEDEAFANKISSLPTQEQIPLMRSWLAKRTFKFYYDKYFAEIKSKQEQTGRKIKTETYKSDEKTHKIIEKDYWLDRGELDDKKCRTNAELNRCDYPDGFEEYSISYEIITSKDKKNVTETLIIDKDDISENSRQFIVIHLTHVTQSSSNNNYDNIIIGATATTEKYDERHKYRNQKAADTRAGKYKDNISDLREWGINPLPDAAVMDVLIDYSHTHETNK